MLERKQPNKGIERGSLSSTPQIQRQRLPSVTKRWQLFGAEQLEKVRFVILMLVEDFAYARDRVWNDKGECSHSESVQEVLSFSTQCCEESRTRSLGSLFWP